MRAMIQGYLPDTTCELSGKTAECLIVTFEDGFPTEAKLSVREFMKLVRLKAQQEKRASGAEKGPGGRPSTDSRSTA